MRLAWFSPLPPQRSGIAAYTRDALAVLGGRHRVEVFADDGPGSERPDGIPGVAGVPVLGAHDFPWRQARTPYDAAVYQIGNDICHDYTWPYLIRYPGLVVLHDAQLHQARARALLRRGHEDRYLDEFVYSHPEADADIGRLVVAGLGGSLYYFWPMVRIPVEAARVVAVHTAWLARELTDAFPGARVTRIRMGVPDPLPAATVPAAEIRRRHMLPDDAVVFGSFGRVTPEKSLTHVLLALAQVAPDAPGIRLLVVGDTPAYYDLTREARDLGIADRVTVTGYVSDEELPSYLAAVDVCLNLRWPTAREMSGAWIRCLAAGKPTIITDLLHLADVPSLDLRSGRVLGAADAAREPVCVSVELVDELHMLRLALRHLGTDARLRARVGEAARQHWAREATPEVMAHDYDAALEATVAAPLPAPRPEWPAHLRDDGHETARAILAAMDMTVELPGQRRPESRTPNPESRGPGPESRTPNPESRW